MSSNIRILSVDITGDKELVTTLNEFKKLVTLKDKTKESRQQETLVLDRAEDLLGGRLGAVVQRGKLGQATVTDYALTPASGIVKYLYGAVSSEIEKYRSQQLEFKASTAGETTVGRLTINTTSSFFIPGTDSQVKGSDIIKKVGVQTGDSTYLLDLDPRTKSLNNGADISDIVFNDYFKKDSNLRNIFYTKASSMALATSRRSPNGSINKVVFIKFPISKFNSQFFKASKENRAIKVAIKTSFQKAIIRQINESHLEALERIRPIKKTITSGKKTFIVDFLSRGSLEGAIRYGVEQTSSLRARPVDTFSVTVPELPSEDKKPKRQAFISSVQWTALTQQRLGQTMSRLGPPDPPDLKERSGRFRASIQVFADYRRRILQYTYNPLYQSLEQYGYRPDVQVQTAIREVAQSLYTQQFNIRRA